MAAWSSSGSIGVCNVHSREAFIYKFPVPFYLGILEDKLDRFKKYLLFLTLCPLVLS
jgi:hypothetical protein